jgi:hypothetical protein
VLVELLQPLDHLEIKDQIHLLVHMQLLLLVEVVEDTQILQVDLLLADQAVAEAVMVDQVQALLELAHKEMLVAML